jgi:hypothetical protein
MLRHAEQDVLHHAQVLGERKLLVNHGHAGGSCVDGIARAIRLSVERHLAFIGRVSTGKNLHERAFSSAIFAHQCKDVSRGDFQINARQRNGCAEAFADAPHRQAWRNRILRR